MVENSTRPDRTGADSGDAPSKTGDDRLWIPVETLAVLNWLGDVGVEGVDSRISRVTGDELTVRTEQVKVNYAGRATIPVQFGVEDRAGAQVSVKDPIAGNILALFPTKSANRAASLMLQKAVDDVDSIVATEMGRDALTELSNMMANGFVDRWAEVFDSSIDTGPPVAVQNPELTLIQRAFTDSEVGLYLTSRLRIPEHDIRAEIFVFPRDEEFLTKLAQVDPSEIHR